MIRVNLLPHAGERRSAQPSQLWLVVVMLLVVVEIIGLFFYHQTLEDELKAVNDEVKQVTDEVTAINALVKDHEKVNERHLLVGIPDPFAQQLHAEIDEQSARDKPREERNECGSSHEHHNQQGRVHYPEDWTKRPMLRRKCSRRRDDPACRSSGEPSDDVGEPRPVQLPVDVDIALHLQLETASGYE